MITFTLVDSWTCCKFQERSLKEKRHTFKSHICARWKLVTLKRLLKPLLQGGVGNISILLVFFVQIIDLRDEIIEFREDRHNRNCLWSVTMKSLDSKWPYHSSHVAHWRTSVPIPITGEIRPERNKTWAHCRLSQIKEGKNAPYCMDLILYFICFCFLLYEREYILKFFLVPCLETRRVVEDKLWVALEGEFIIHIMDPPLWHQSQRPD